MAMSESTRSAWRLADADQDAGGEGDAELARERDRLEPARRHLVGRAIVRGAGPSEPLGDALQHDAHADVDLAERRPGRART